MANNKTHVFIGNVGEDWFEEQCLTRNLNIKRMPRRHKFDFLVNGYRIDVKTASVSRNPPSLVGKLVGNQYSFHIPAKKIREIDFFVLYILPEDEVFIVPTSIPLPIAGRLFITWPNNWNKVPRYREYLSAWHLLKIRQIAYN